MSDLGTGSAAAPVRPALVAVAAMPVASALVLGAAWSTGWFDDRRLYAGVLSVAIGAHHLPTLLRVVASPGMRRRCGLEAALATVAIPVGVATAVSAGRLGAVLCVVALFDVWHIAAQQFGVGRLLAGDDGAPRLERLAVHGLYVASILASGAWRDVLGRTFAAGGIAPPTALSGESARLLAGLVAGVGLTAFVAVVARVRSPRGWAMVAAHAVALAIVAASYQSPSWYRAIAVQNLFHSAQYFVLVWTTERSRHDPPPLHRALFGGVPLAGLGLCLAWGFVLSVLGHGEARTVDGFLAVGAASQLVHYQLDALVWRRENPRHTTVARGAWGVGYVTVPLLAVIGFAGR